MKLKHFAKFIPAILWMGFIFYLSSRSTAGIGTNSLNRFLILKTFHLIEYAILAIFLYFPINKSRNTILMAYLYALSDEFHQSFVPGRGPKLTDTLIDLLGIFIGLLIFQSIRKSYFLFHKSP